MVLLLRSVLEGNYWQAVQFSPAVIAVTLLACLLAIRWAIDQFNRESVLFRESERLDLGLWLRHLWRDRQPTPTVAAAVCCGVLILVVNFFVGSSLAMPEGFGGFAWTVLVTQLAVIAAPALLMTILLTGSPRQTLLLKWPPWLTIPAAALLAVLLHPAANLLQTAVQQFYPVSENVRPALEKMQGLFRQADFWPLVFVIALVPAVCEELAFRGFILSGFRHLGHKRRAVIYQRAVVRTHPRHLAAIADRLPAGHDPRIAGRAERQHFARHGVPRRPQYAGRGQQPRHARDDRRFPDAPQAGHSGRRRRLHVRVAAGGRRIAGRRAVADAVRPAQQSAIAGRGTGRGHRARLATRWCMMCAVSDVTIVPMTAHQHHPRSMIA